ncbi:MAG: HlyC/CorC family transporter [Parafilimonas sp.]|nr:HlyC/CorC family transporter [Parafilimonas sp.]
MTEILIIIGLILLNGIFSMVEIALVSCRKVRLEAQANKGDKRAKAALDLANHPDKFISTTQIGITLTAIINGILSGEELTHRFATTLSKINFIGQYNSIAATIIVVFIVTYLTLVIGELVPKRIGLSNPERIAKTFAAFVRVSIFISYPFVVLLTKSGNFIINLFKIKGQESNVTEDEIKAIINEGTEQGAIEEAEQEIIERVFHLGDRNITSLMTHRSDIIWLDINLTVDDINNMPDEKIHSIYPVCDGTIDKIKGIVSLKNIIKAKPGTPLKDVMTTGFFVPENNSAYKLLERFKELKSHYAFIVDEYGTVQGLVTLNDILDAIVGEVPHLDEELYEIVERKDGSYLIDAQIPFYNFLSYFEHTDYLDEDEQQFDTLAGFILNELERIPQAGDQLEWHGFKFEIMDMDNNRIDKILVYKPEEEELKSEND